MGVLSLATILSGLLGAPTPTGGEITFQHLTNELLPEDKVRNAHLAPLSLDPIIRGLS
jgi:hypothetical protein